MLHGENAYVLNIFDVILIYFIVVDSLVLLKSIRVDIVVVDLRQVAVFKLPSIVDLYETQGHPYFASARLWDDGIIDPKETRQVLAHALTAVASAPIPDSNFGIFRM